MSCNEPAPALPKLYSLAIRHNGTAPWHYVDFLDYAAERLLLHKVGSGYMFIHRRMSTGESAAACGST